MGISNRLYCDIVRGMHGRGMLACLPVGERVVVNGMFLVPKSDGRWRLIIDAQPANAHFVSPPYVHLPSPSDIAGLISSSEFFVAKLDIDNYYHRLRLPSCYHRFFALPPLPARLIGPAVEAQYGADTLVHPCCATLPMGWSHSVFLAHSAHLHIISQHTSIHVVPPSSPLTHVTSSASAFVYIDDLNLFSHSKSALVRAMSEAEAAYAGINLLVKDAKRVGPVSVAEQLGLEVDGSLQRVGVSVDKMVICSNMIDALLRDRHTTGERLSHLVGVITWIFLVRRPLLSVLRSVYRFIAVAGPHCIPLWPSVSRELRAIQGLLPLAFASTSAPWLNNVFATDACTTGGAVCTAAASPDVVLSLACLASNRGDTVRMGDPPLNAATRMAAPSPLPLSFPSLSWHTVISTHWLFSSHINLLELQSVLLCFRRLSTLSSAINSRIIFLIDSRVAVGCLAKGRSSSSPLLHAVRRVSAVCLALGIHPFFVWIPSECNPADEPSRR